MKLVILLLPAVLLAQYPGQYPPGQYPPGQYPPGQYPPNYPPNTVSGPMGVPIQIPSVRLPTRKGKTQTAEQKVSVASVEGMLRQLGEKDLLLEIPGARVLKFRLLAKTQFRAKDGKPMRDSLLHPGDRLTVDANSDDPETALFVNFVRAGSKAEREGASVPLDTARVTTPEATDLGRPHGVSEPETIAPSPSGTASETEKDERPVLTRKPEGGAGGSVIDEARAASANFTAELPNFLVEQATTRFAGMKYVPSWRAVDVVTADVSSVSGKEEYKNVRVNGRPTEHAENSGSWSTGEFSTTLEDIMSPRTAAAFSFRGESRVANRPALVYDLTVSQANSHWILVTPERNKYAPAYTGAVFIDMETHRVLRIEQKAVNLPRTFAYDKAESTLEYGFVMIEGSNYLLPVESENMACESGSLNCVKNVIEFRNYRKFGSDTNIRFDQFRVAL